MRGRIFPYKRGGIANIIAFWFLGGDGGKSWEGGGKNGRGSTLRIMMKCLLSSDLGHELRQWGEGSIFGVLDAERQGVGEGGGH